MSPGLNYPRMLEHVSARSDLASVNCTDPTIWKLSLRPCPAHEQALTRDDSPVGELPPGNLIDIRAIAGDPTVQNRWLPRLCLTTRLDGPAVHAATCARVGTAFRAGCSCFACGHIVGCHRARCLRLSSHSWGAASRRPACAQGRLAATVSWHGILRRPPYACGFAVAELAGALHV